ncbi:MAG TPA: carbohydrate ABC transporter permease [Thermomicrobiales bacterium]|nr:carbohydrate ABC transporter permease [Thermomicrobiales bacterium]
MTHVAERGRPLDRATPLAPATTKRRLRLAWLGPLGRHALLIAVAAVFLLPFYWMVMSGLKSNTAIFARPLQWWPDPVHWENIGRTINAQAFPYLRLLANSALYAGCVTVGTVLSCAAVGYGFARLRFPGRDLLFAITLATLMIPPIVTFIPTYVLFANLKLTGSYVPLILPAFFGNAFFIFMMRQFFLGIPGDLSDAARIDGAGEYRIFWQIMLPLVRPALMVVAVFTLLYTWHEFFPPLIYLQDRAQFPLSVGLYAFRSQRTAEWASIMMGSFLTTLPLIVVFLFTQRYFLRGIATTGLKG